MKKKCIAMILAGGQGSRLYALTSQVAKPNLPFGGKYCIVDFSLSNCANSGIDTVGVLTQYQPLKLNRYIGSGTPWNLDSADGGAFILPPYIGQGNNGSWFQGTANAIYQNIEFADLYDPDYVLILSGDHIYKMDYSKMLNAHIEKGAACTISAINVDLEDAGRFGIINLGEDGYISGFEEKPKNPRSTLASMGVYIFSWNTLKEYLRLDELDKTSSKDFGKNIIPMMLERGERLYAYEFAGYWRDVGTIESLWEANMDMLTPETINLFDPSWPIRGRTPIQPPHYTGPESKIVHSVVSEGCEINGMVDNSVLSNSVTVQTGARVSYSILMPGVTIEEGAVVEFAIIAEGTRICRNARVGSAPDGSSSWGVATCGAGITVLPGAVVAPGAMIYTDVEGAE